MCFKRSLKVLVLAALTSAIAAGTAFAGNLTVYSTSDVHGSLIGWNYFKAEKADVGLAKISTILNEARAHKGKDDAIMYIDAGDIMQGTPVSNYLANHPESWKAGDYPMFAAYRQMGCDAIVLGNHEYTFGIDFLTRAIAKNNNILSANMIDEKTGKTWSKVHPTIVKTVKVDGEKVKVGIIGVTTPAIPNLEAADHYKGFRFEDEVTHAKQCVAALRKQGADVIIIAAHSGVQRSAEDGAENQVAEIAKACPEANLIIAAHNHVAFDTKSGVKAFGGASFAGAVINGVPVIESGKDGKFVGKSDLTLKKVNGKWVVTAAKTENISVKGIVDDAAIEKIAKPVHEKTLADLQTVIGKSTGEFSGKDSALKDSTIVDFVNNVQREIAGTQLSAAAAFNPGAVIPAGNITRQDVAGLYIYENYLCGIEITGAELRKYMEFAAEHYNNGPSYNYDMFQGVDYTIDLTKPTGHKITKLQYKGKNVQDTDTFTMAINDYRMNGGGGYLAAMGYTNGRKPKVVFDSLKLYGDAGQVRNLIEKYIRDHGTISPTVDHNWNVIEK